MNISVNFCGLYVLVCQRKFLTFFNIIINYNNFSNCWVIIFFLELFNLYF